MAGYVFQGPQFEPFLCAVILLNQFQTRMQSLACEKQQRMGVFKMLSTMMREEGFFR